jgi:hypothetical protein
VGASPASFQISQTISPKELPVPSFSLTTESLRLLNDPDLRSGFSFERTHRRVALSGLFRNARALLLAGSGKVFKC